MLKYKVRLMVQIHQNHVEIHQPAVFAVCMNKLQLGFGGSAPHFTCIFNHRLSDVKLV